MAFGINNFNGSGLSSEQQNFDLLDIITMVGFFAQMDNMSKDEEQTEYIHGVIETIEKEIEKLHKENDIIIEQNNTIIHMLEELKEK